MQPREHNRYRLGVPVIFWWQDARKVRRQAAGLTRDISVRGAFVFTPSPPPFEANVKLQAFLPPVRGAVQSGRIHGQGRVVRVDPVPDTATPVGFAVAGKGFVLRRGEEYR